MVRSAVASLASTNPGMTMAQLRALVYSHNDPPHPHDARTPRAAGCRLRGAALRAGLGSEGTSLVPH